jgi:hypothetical protein
VIVSLSAQPVSDYTIKLDNGIKVRTEQCWSHVWIQQTYEPVKPGDKTPPVSANIRALGDLISGSSFKLMKSGKEIKLQGAEPGSYDMKFTFNLSGEPGTLSFIVNNILIKPKTKTAVSVVLYDYQILIDENKDTQGDYAGFETKINRCKVNTIQDIYHGIPVFYEAGRHDKPILPHNKKSETSGKIKAGTYDLLVTINISDQLHKIWLENFEMKAGTNYTVAINLNAGIITYSGTNRSVKSIHLYPAGTSASQTGKPIRAKNLEVISYDNISVANCCSPGTYDILMDFGNSNYEWKRNIVVSTGAKTQIK